MHVGQSIVTTGMAERQPLVIEAHQVQDRGMKIMHMNGVLFRSQSMFIRRPVDRAASYPCSRQPL